MGKKNNLKNVNNKFIMSSLIIDKNTPAYKFQSIRKEDLYKKGRKGIILNYIFFIGTLLSETSKNVRIKSVLQYFNLNLILSLNKNSRNLIVLRKIKYKNNLRW